MGKNEKKNSQMRKKKSKIDTITLSLFIYTQHDMQSRRLIARF